MKILHVIPSYLPAFQYGGPIKAVHELCREQVRQGQEVSVFTTDADGRKSLKVATKVPQNIEGVKVTYFPLKFLRRYYYSFDLNEALKINIGNFDIVHIHAVFVYSTIIAARWCQKRGIPYVINAFGALDKDMVKLRNSFLKNIYINLIERININQASLLLAASAYEQERFKPFGFKTQVAIMPRGISVNEYIWNERFKTDFIKRYPMLAGKEILLFLGRIHSKKGLDLLAAAFKKILQKNSNVALAIAGTGEGRYVSKIKNLFASLGCRNNVVFTGMLLGQEKLQALYASDIFILPSYGENFGISVLEAMACKLPVVITNKVGLFPDVQEFNAGSVINCNVEECAQAVLGMLNDGKNRRALGDNGRRLVEDRFTLDIVSRRSLEIYQAVLLKKQKAVA